MVTNATGDALLLWDVEIPPGEQRPISLAGKPDCLDDVVLVTADLEFEIGVNRTVCDGDRVTLHSADLVPVRYPASVRNMSSTSILVTFEGGPGVKGLSLEPGERTRIVLVAARGGCSDGRLFARAVESGDGEVVAHHPGPVCSGEEWVVNDDALAGGAAHITVVNETDLTFRIDAFGVPGVARGEQLVLGPEETYELNLGVARGACVEGVEIIARTDEEDDADELVTATMELCDGNTWVIAWEDLQGIDRELGRWVPAFPASIVAANTTRDASVRLTIDGEDRAVLEPLERETIPLGVVEGGCVSLEVAFWTVSDVETSSPLLAVTEVCDGDVLEVGVSPGLHRAGELLTSVGQ